MKQIGTKLFILFTLLAATFTAASPKKPLKVLYAIPRTEQDMFFGPSVGFMRMAAKSLGVTLEIVESNGNHLITAKQIETALTQPNRPDAVIALSAKENGRDIIKVCQSKGVPLFIENAAILDSTVGKPRQKYSHYIGEMIPDDFQAGYLLAKKLIAQAPSAIDGKIHVVAINGPHGNGPARAREQGLRQAIRETPKAVLKQIVYAEWDPAKAKTVTTGLLKRYPETSVIWAASDGMALAASESAAALGKKTGKSLLVGGVDWSHEGIAAIQQGKIHATVGGQFMEAAWALVVVYDYLNGFDFAKTGTRINTEMALMTSHNRASYTKLLNKENWNSIPFRSFSKSYNSAMKKYDFSIKRILSLIQ